MHEIIKFFILFNLLVFIVIIPNKIKKIDKKIVQGKNPNKTMILSVSRNVDILKK
jgi:hypothetical protein